MQEYCASPNQETLFSEELTVHLKEPDAMIALFALYLKERQETKPKGPVV